jgi:DNA-binding response OmpR family regulator
MPSTPSPDVLIVEDDHALSHLLVLALREIGLTTDVADSVIEAKRLLSRAGYGVVILDLILADGTGFDVLDFIRSEKLMPLKIIVITAADASLLVRLDRSMVKSVMFKPLDLNHFLDFVRVLALDHSTRRL